MIGVKHLVGLTDEELLTAASWLDVIEGEESASCHKVANWLREQAHILQNETIVEEIAQQTGATMSQARDAWHCRYKQ